MTWTELARRRHDRAGDGYASDLTDAEWALIKLRAPPRRSTGGPRRTHLRGVFDAILHIAAPPRLWRMPPNDFPPVPTARSHFHAWRDDGLPDESNRKLVGAARLAEGRKARPMAGIIDSQSAKATEGGGVGGHDAGKRIKGRKRHIVTGMAGFPVGHEAHGAGVQDRDGGPSLLNAGGARYPMSRHIFAGGGYAGSKPRDALKAVGKWTVQIVKRSDAAEGFEVLPRRRVIQARDSFTPTI